jgi:hypothetical protein
MTTCKGFIQNTPEMEKYANGNQAKSLSLRYLSTMFLIGPGLLKIAYPDVFN